MKAFKFLISMFVVAACLTGCDNESNENQPEVDNREELLLSTEIATAELTGVETKAEEAFTNVKFDLIIRDNVNGIADVKSLATTDNTQKEGKAVVGLTPKQYWDDLGGTAGDLKLAGVYPKDVTFDDNNTILAWSAKADQSSESNFKGSDLLLAYVDSYEYSDRKTAANLQFSHVLTKITLNLGGNLLSAEQLAGAVVKFNGVVVAGKVSLLPTSGSYTYTENTTQTEVTPYRTTLSSGDYASSYAAIVYPFTKATTTEDNKVTIATITVKSSSDGTGTETNTYYVKLPKEEKKFNAGENNVYNVSINKTDVLVTASVVNWTNIGNVDLTSKLSFEPGNITISQGQNENIEITTGSVLYLSITDTGSNPAKHSTAYVLNDDGKWELQSGKSPIYWDDLAQPYSSNEATALLILDGDTEANRKNGDKIFTSTTTLGSTIATPFTLNDLTHPMAKFTITVETSGESDADKINLADIQSVNFATGWNTFAINTTNTGIKETSTALQGTKQGDTFVYVAYIAPEESSQGTLNNICTVVVKTNGITNSYAVNLGTGAATTFTAGNHYQYKVKITKTQITFTGTVVGWTDQAEEDLETQL